MNKEDFDKAIDDMPDDVLQWVAQASMPWQTPANISAEDVDTLVDEDGFKLFNGNDYSRLPNLQRECWNKFSTNPQINSHVRDFMGSLTGAGFHTSSDIPKIQEVIELIEEDPRNALYMNMTKYVARSEIEGELFLVLTLHSDGFVEVDFMDPRTLKGGGDNNSGIWFHPSKKTMPLMYRFEVDGTIHHIPSINLAYYPSMYAKLKETPNYGNGNTRYEKSSRSTGNKFRSIGGFKRFVVCWDRGFLTNRNVSHIKTTITWINHYENLKKWEIDHKKSSGSYLWVVSIEDAKAYRGWLKLTDEEKKATGLYAKKTPGGTLVLPPGLSIECKNPQLPRISDADTDIMHMVTSGLNKPEDMVTGVTKGSTFSGVKASRAPMSDRINNESEYFERFLRFEFWRAIFFLHKVMVTSFPATFTVEEAVDFVDKKPKMKKVSKPVHKLIDFEFPTSEVSDIESKAKAYLGSKHPPLVEYLGIPRQDIAKRLGFSGYRRRRLITATEEETLPELKTSSEIESNQETSNGGDSNNQKSTQIPSEKKPSEKTDNKKEPERKP